MKIEIDDDVLEEFRYILELRKANDTDDKEQTLDSLVNQVLYNVADGSRRPGAWEREMLNMMGLVVECEEHQQYRSKYGKPT
jgi:hypothetical protein